MPLPNSRGIIIIIITTTTTTTTTIIVVVVVVIIIIIIITIIILTLTPKLFLSFSKDPLQVVYGLPLGSTLMLSNNL